MNETSFNKVFYDGYLVTYAPAHMAAYSPMYPGIDASNSVIQLLMRLHMQLRIRT
jgi:hypothetical protein